jgi:hypothetical protein
MLAGVVAAAVSAVIAPVDTMALSTICARLRAPFMLRVGASRDGACTSPASIAACGSVSRSGWR